MEKEEKKYLAISQDTQKPYITKDREAFLFLDEFQAKSFRRKIKNIELLNTTSKSYAMINSLCYANGALFLNVIGSDGQPLRERINPLELKRRYYNSDLTAFLGVGMRDKDLDFIRRIKSCTFIIPVHIDKTKEQYITYASAKNKAGERTYLAFTDLFEYNKWAKEYGNIYKPLEINFLGLYRISGGKRGFLINVMNSKYILTSKFLTNTKDHLSEETKCLI